MKRQLIIYILAAFCATAIISCNKERAVDSIGPDNEYTVLLTASIDASTKAVSIDESKVVSTWEVGEKVDLVYRDTIISTLDVISVSGDKAQLSGKVRGGYEIDAPMKLYYGGTSYDYSDQTGTVSSAISKAYLQAETKIASKEGKTLTLESVQLKHQQAYMSLTFYNYYSVDTTPAKVKSVKIVDVLDTQGDPYSTLIVKSHALGVVDPSYYDYSQEGDRFMVSSSEGQESFFFALNDTSVVNDHFYTLEIITADDKSYTGKVAAPKGAGNYFADTKVILEKSSPVITPPTIYANINYDGLAHNLIIPGEVQPGAIISYIVSASAPKTTDNGWSTAVPQATQPGGYDVWYKVSGGTYYESILPTKIGTTIIKALTAVIVPPTSRNPVYNGTAQELVNAGYVTVDSSPIIGASLEYYLTTDYDYTPTGAENNWSTDIPKGIEPNDAYYIWYRFPGNIYLSPVMTPSKVEVIINRRPLTIKAKDQTVNSGENLVVSLDQVVLSGLLDGHSLESITFLPSGSINSNTSIVLSNAVIKDNATEDVTSKYVISYVNGTVTVN